MKNIYTLLAFFLTLQLSAQTPYERVDDLVRDFTHFWSVPSNHKAINTLRGTELTHKLDSIVTKNGFDQSVARTEMDYDSEHRTTELRQFLPDSLTGELVLESIITMEYFGLPYPSNIEIKGYDEVSQQFVTQFAVEYFYDNQQRVDSLIISTEDPFFGGFGPLLATKQVYNGDLLVQSRQWINIILLGGWLPAGYTDYQYDGEGRLLDQLTAVIDFTTGEVLPDSRTGYEYNAEGLLEVQTEYIWEDPSWTPTQRFNYTYFDNETLKSEMRQIYSNGVFDNNVLTTYAVEDVTDAYPFTSYIWDPNTLAWRHTDSTINHLNTSLPWDKVAAPTQLNVLGDAGLGAGFTFTGNSIINTEYLLWDTTGTQLFFNVRDDYYYSLLEGSAVSEVLPDFLTINPNPAQEQFTIYNEQSEPVRYAVYNLTGTKLESGIFSEGSHTVGTASWVPGMYLLEIRLTDGSRYMHKQIIE